MGTSYQRFDYKAGFTPRQIEREVLACEVDALRAAPVSTEREVDATELLAEALVILVLGTDTNEEETGDVDYNAKAREEYFSACLERNKIMTSVFIPECNAQVRKRMPVPRSTVYPKLTERSCYVRVASGDTRILTPR